MPLVKTRLRPTRPIGKKWPKKCDWCKMGDHDRCWRVVCYCKHGKVISKGKL